MALLRYRSLLEEDMATIIPVVDSWWGGRPVAGMLPRLFFQHFNETSLVAEDVTGLAGFLIAFPSPSRRGLAYIHFVGVRPDRRRQGVARELYRLCELRMKAAGCVELRCLTSLINRRSVAFHLSLGFELMPGDAVEDGLPVHRDHDHRGRDCVLFQKRLAASAKRCIDVLPSAIVRFYEELWNRGRLERAGEVLHEEFRFVGSLARHPVGRHGFETYLGRVRAALGSYRCDVLEAVSEPPRYFLRMAFGGIHQRSFRGVPATGKPLRWEGAARFELEGGRIRNLWVLGDQAGLDRQLAAARDRGLALE